MRLFRFDEKDFAVKFRAFLNERRGSPADVDAAAANVLEAVRTEGISAVLRFSRQFDRADLTEDTLGVSQAEIEAGVAACDPAVREAIAFAAARIAAYHERQRPADLSFTDEAGVGLGWRWTALESVGVYVPGGRAAYPSTVLMNCVPARAAGVERIAMVTPPGRLEPAVLAAAAEAGVTEIWRVGGSQAIAALAYGAGPIQPVDKIVGPGNAYVTAAKRRLYGVVGLDALAGPSEIVVVADAANDPAWIAADLLSQAEHGPDSQVLHEPHHRQRKDIQALSGEGAGGEGRGRDPRREAPGHGAVARDVHSRSRVHGPEGTHRAPDHRAYRAVGAPRG